jgi:hypothetical protein
MAGEEHIFPSLRPAHQLGKLGFGFGNGNLHFTPVLDYEIVQKWKQISFASG